MTKLILQIFEALKAHSLLRWFSLAGLTIVLGLLLTKQSYKEDISDFLPLDNMQQQAFQDYQNTSSARRIYVIFQGADSICNSACDFFGEVLDGIDTNHTIDYMTSDNPEVMLDAMKAIYARMPYLLTEDDYIRIDSLLGKQDFISQQLENDKQLLMLPTAGMMTQQIQHDPLNLFTPVLERLRPTQTGNQSLLLIDSPYGASETENNANLVSMLKSVCDSVHYRYADVSVHLTGGPVIAVGNAKQIKTDSLTSIALAIILILLLLWMTFRNMRNLLLIVVSIGWGWLFAMGCLTLIHNDVSIIVIGISSVIVGIAVNYPLHLIAHLNHTVNIRSALKEIVIPLVVGNLTTVGAFLALVPLDSVALRDLGLFSAFLLIGTILFVLIWLPHMVSRNSKVSKGIFDKIGEIQLEKKSWVNCSVIVISLFLGYYSLQTSFDTDLRNINYMTAEQKQDMKFLEQLSSPQSQTSNVELWDNWRKAKGSKLCDDLKNAAIESGFASDSFDDFYNIILEAPKGEGLSLTSAIVNNLSDNFNYIGWACGFIVFFFLWFSLGSIELALLSFLPMAVSWVWILGIMSLLDIQFNVVNIILATFIFGQGDDYTIFMTEGCQYEYAYRRKMLSSYKHSIVISALIMFIGIGSLIIAKHPALFSLAEVTIIGMFSVVLMAYLIPPLIFRWLVYTDGKERQRPITLSGLFVKDKKVISIVCDWYRYRGIEIISSVKKRLRKYEKNGCFQLFESQLLPTTKTVVFINSGWGELAAYFALQNPQINVISVESGKDQLAVARNVAENRLPNLSVRDSVSDDILQKGKEHNEMQTFLLDPSDSDIKEYSDLKPIIIQ